MSKTLLLAPALFAAACIGEGPAPERSDSPSDPIAFDQLHIGESPVVIATGGTQTVSIADVATVGWSGSASTGFELAPYAGIWPNTRKQDYLVRAVASAGAGTFTIQTNRGVASGPVDSADVAKVALVPASYHLDGHSAFALDVSRPDVQVALVDATNRRLVDGSVVVVDTGDAAAAQTAWDTIGLAAAVGTRTLHVTGDSFADEQLTIAITSDHSDRVETETADGRTCFHAYAGNVEIAKAMPLTGTPDPEFVNCQR